MRNSVICTFLSIFVMYTSVVLSIRYEYQDESHVQQQADSDSDSLTEAPVEDPPNPPNRASRTTEPKHFYVTWASIPIPKARDVKNIDCDNFVSYAVKCTEVAGTMYGSSRKSPPMAGKLQDWCNALIHLTNCASDWNTECKNVAENHFDYDSLEGHIHVVDNICLNANFTKRYKEAGPCIEDTTFEWEFCYSQFKDQIDDMKNSSLSWTHYQTHFILCCARAAFCACTLQFLFTKNTCTRIQAMTMQRFSVIISEGDVHQDCDKSMNYANCPGGDPHLKAESLLKMRGIGQNVSAIPEETDKLRNLFTNSFAHRDRVLRILILFQFHALAVLL